MIAHDLFDWTNFTFGAVGLALTGWAIWQATGAKAAARQAAQSILRHDAQADFDALRQMARDLLGYLQNGMMAEARVRVGDLRSGLAVAIPLYAMFLGVEIGPLKEKQLRLKLVEDLLSRRSPPLSEAERGRLRGEVSEILVVVAGQVGNLRRSSVEREAPNG